MTVSLEGVTTTQKPKPLPQRKHEIDGFFEKLQVDNEQVTGEIDKVWGSPHQPYKPIELSLNDTGVYSVREGNHYLNVSAYNVEIWGRHVLVTVSDHSGTPYMQALSNYKVALYNHKTGLISEPKVFEQKYVSYFGRFSSPAGACINFSEEDCRYEADPCLKATIEEHYKADASKEFPMSLIVFKAESKPLVTA